MSVKQALVIILCVMLALCGGIFGLYIVSQKDNTPNRSPQKNTQIEEETQKRTSINENANKEEGNIKSIELRDYDANEYKEDTREIISENINIEAQEETKEVMQKTKETKKYQSEDEENKANSILPFKDAPRVEKQGISEQEFLEKLYKEIEENPVYINGSDDEIKEINEGKWDENHIKFTRINRASEIEVLRNGWFNIKGDGYYYFDKNGENIGTTEERGNVGWKDSKFYTRPDEYIKEGSAIINGKKYKFTNDGEVNEE